MAVKLFFYRSLSVLSCLGESRNSSGQVLLSNAGATGPSRVTLLPIGTGMLVGFLAESVAYMDSNDLLQE
jgi:hypothetical protein